MTLARVWTRQLYGAGGVALLAPVTIIAVLAVLALSGGFGGLSALGQLLSGPAVPVGSLAAGGRPAPLTAAAPLPVVPVSTAPKRIAARATTHVVAPAPRSAAPGRAPARVGRGQLVSTGGHGSTAAPPASSPPAPPAPPVSSPPPPPAPGPVASIVNQVVAVGVSVTSQLPAPVATLGTGVLESLGQTLDTVLAPPS